MANEVLAKTCFFSDGPTHLSRLGVTIDDNHQLRKDALQGDIPHEQSQQMRSLVGRNDNDERNHLTRPTRATLLKVSSTSGIKDCTEYFSTTRKRAAAPICLRSGSSRIKALIR